MRRRRRLETIVVVSAVAGGEWMMVSSWLLLSGVFHCSSCKPTIVVARRQSRILYRKFNNMVEFTYKFRSKRRSYDFPSFH